MKYIKNTLALFMILGLLVTPTFASAEENEAEDDRGANIEIRKDFREAREDFRESKGEAREEFRDAVEDHKDALRSEFAGLTKEERKAKIAEMQADVNEKLLARLDTFVERAVELFEKTVTRMNSFADKVETLIGRLEDKHEGLNLTNAKTLLATAETKIALITSSLAQLESDADALIAGSDNAKDAFQEVKELIKTFKNEKVKPAHDALVEAVRAVKAGVPQNDND